MSHDPDHFRKRAGLHYVTVEAMCSGFESLPTLELRAMAHDLKEALREDMAHWRRSRFVDQLPAPEYGALRSIAEAYCRLQFRTNSDPQKSHWFGQLSDARSDLWRYAPKPE